MEGLDKKSIHQLNSQLELAVRSLFREDENGNFLTISNCKVQSQVPKMYVFIKEETRDCTLKFMNINNIQNKISVDNVMLLETMLNNISTQICRTLIDSQEEQRLTEELYNSISQKVIQEALFLNTKKEQLKKETIDKKINLLGLFIKIRTIDEDLNFQDEEISQDTLMKVINDEDSLFCSIFASFSILYFQKKKT